MSVMRFGNVEATIKFDEDISMFRGEFFGMKGGKDFYAASLDQLRKEGERRFCSTLQTKKTYISGI